MSKLLNTNFHELFKAKFFYITMLICGGLGILLTILMYKYPSFNFPEGADIVIDKSNVLSLMPNFGSVFIPFAAASTVALILDAQYNQGVIRNKIITGHNRTAVFLSGLLVSCFVAVVYFVIYEVCVFSVAIFLFDYDKFDFKATIITLAVMLLMIMCISSVLSFVLGNMLRGGKMIVIILGVQYALNASLVLGMFPDNKVAEIISKIFPQSCMFTFSYSAVPDKIEQNVIVSAILMAMLIIFGSFNFKKCDIK